MSKKSGKAVRLLLVGSRGRMGREIQSLLREDSTFNLAGTVNETPDWKACDPGNVDLVVEFSSLGGFEAALRWCLRHRKPLVSGTTGLKATQTKALRKAARTLPILYSANMSLGIAVLCTMLESLAAVRDWDFQIEEAHHSRKKDRPSGTGLLLESKLEEAIQRQLPPTQSIRGGGIPGIHQVWAMGPEETLILQHTAFNRTVFARGALTAARWLFDKNRPGLYDLKDLYQ